MIAHRDQTGFRMARHCSHCFQYFLASRVLAFFYAFFEGVFVIFKIKA